jgi:hypothetical protein
MDLGIILIKKIHISFSAIQFLSTFKSASVAECCHLSEIYVFLSVRVSNIKNYFIKIFLLNFEDVVLVTSNLLPHGLSISVLRCGF